VTDKQCNHVAANWVWLAKQEYAAKDMNMSRATSGTMTTLLRKAEQGS
jgi:hypothetical protein